MEDVEEGEEEEEGEGAGLEQRGGGSKNRLDLHLEIGSLAASISANKTRFSSSTARSHSLANSRLDHRSARERELVQALGG
jgi:hypothetical protein